VQKIRRMLGILRLALAVPLLIACLLLAEDAAAQEPQRVTTRWYGGQTLITMGASSAVGLLGAALWLPDRRESLEPVRVSGLVISSVGLAGWVLGGPIVHLAHERWGAAAGSFGLTLGLPLAGGLLGWELTCGSSRCGPGLGEGVGFVVALFGATVGASVAAVVDVAVLAREEVPVSPPTPGGASKPAAWSGRKGAWAAMPLQLGFRF
jgi:hypothetical protein